MGTRGRSKALLELSDEERETLLRWSRRPKSPQSLAQRSRIVLGCADVLDSVEVARQLGVHQLRPQHRAVEFRKFLEAIDAAVPPDLDVHVILDNSSTHKTPEINRWLLRHPRFVFHFTPTRSSWLNLVERWFAKLTRKLLQRSAHRTVAALTADLNTWIATWNENRKPFVWHKTADEILETSGLICHESLTQVIRRSSRG